MATPLTWRNVELQNFGSTLGAMSDANDGLMRSFDSIGKVLANNEIQARQKATQQAVAGALLANDLSALDQVRGGLVPGENRLVDASQVATAINQRAGALRQDRVLDDSWANTQWMQSPEVASRLGAIAAAGKTGEFDPTLFTGRAVQLADEALAAQRSGVTRVDGRDDEMFDRKDADRRFGLSAAENARAGERHRAAMEDRNQIGKGAQLARDVTAQVTAANPSAGPEAISLAVQATLRRNGIDPKLEAQAMQHVPGEIAFNTDPNFLKIMGEDRAQYANAPDVAPGQALSTEQAKQLPLSELQANIRTIDNTAATAKAGLERENYQAWVSREAKKPENAQMTWDQAWKAAGGEGDVPTELTRHGKGMTPFEVVQLANRSGAINRDDGLISDVTGILPISMLSGKSRLFGGNQVQDNNLERTTADYLKNRDKLETEADQVIAKLEREAAEKKKAAEAEIKRRANEASRKAQGK